MIPNAPYSPVVHIFAFNEAGTEGPEDDEHRGPVDREKCWDWLDLDDEFDVCKCKEDLEAMVLWLFAMATEMKGYVWPESGLREGQVERLGVLCERRVEQEGGLKHKLVERVKTML